MGFKIKLILFVIAIAAIYFLVPPGTISEFWTNVIYAGITVIFLVLLSTGRTVRR
ncbi:MAG: hypothetical protein AABX91_00055 [Nanoarchaeota archaeon]